MLLFIFVNILFSIDLPLPFLFTDFLTFLSFKLSFSTNSTLSYFSPNLSSLFYKSDLFREGIG